MSKTKVDPTEVTRVRSLLGEVHHATGLDNVQSAINNARTAIERLPAESQLPVLQKAIGKGIRQWRAAATVMGRCGQSPQVDEWITAALNDPEGERREWIVQVIGNERLVRFAPHINRIISDDESSVRQFAIIAAGNLCTDSNCDTLVSFAGSLGDREIPMNLLQSLSKFKSDKTTPFLRRVFEAGADDRHRVYAAWGLGRQGDRRAVEYLVSMLGDPDREGPTFFDPGESRRAAQALCDIFDWPFEWDESYVAKTEARAREAGLIKR